MIAVFASIGSTSTFRLTGQTALRRLFYRARRGYMPLRPTLGEWMRHDELRMYRLIRYDTLGIRLEQGGIRELCAIFSGVVFLRFQVRVGQWSALSTAFQTSARCERLPVLLRVCQFGVFVLYCPLILFWGSKRIVTYFCSLTSHRQGGGVLTV